MLHLFLECGRDVDLDLRCGADRRVLVAGEGPIAARDNVLLAEVDCAGSWVTSISVGR